MGEYLPGMHERGAGLMERKRGPLPEELNIIRKVVWSYIKTNPGLGFDDLFSEACLAYLETVHQYYDPTKISKSTFIYSVVRSRLNDLLYNNAKNAGENLMGFAVDELTNAEELTPEQHLLAQERWEELLAELSPEALVVWELINTTDTYLPTDKPKVCRGILIKLLRREFGWGGPTIWKAFKELKQAASV